MAEHHRLEQLLSALVTTTKGYAITRPPDWDKSASRQSLG